MPASEFRGLDAGRARGVRRLLPARRRRPAPRDDGALALYAWTWLGEAFANAALWERPRVAAAGGAAMGAFAVPALIRAGARDEGRRRRRGRRWAARGDRAGRAPGTPSRCSSSRTPPRRQVRAASTRGRLHLGCRPVAADDAAGLRALRRDRRAARRRLELRRWSRSPATRFADGTSVELSRRPAAGDRGAGGLVARRGRGLARVPRRPARRCGARRERFLTGPPPWPPRRRPGEPRRIRATRCASGRGGRCGSSRAPHARDPRLRMVIERFATYAGRRPAPRARRARGRRLRRARLRRLAPARRHVRARGRAGAAARGARRRAAARRHRVERLDARGGRVRGVGPTAGGVPPTRSSLTSTHARGCACCGGRAAPARRAFAVRPGAAARPARARPPTSPTTDRTFPPTTTPSSTTCSSTGGPVRDPTIYVCTPGDGPGDAPAGHEALVRARQRARRRPRRDWDGRGRAADRPARRARSGRRGVVRRPPTSSARPAPLGGAIYGAAPHGRLGALRRPGSACAGVARAVARRRHACTRAAGCRSSRSAAGTVAARGDRAGRRQRVARRPTSRRGRRARSARTAPRRTSPPRACGGRRRDGRRAP